MKKYKQHYETSTFDHCYMVSYYCYKVCKKLKLDYKSAARAGMLHDFFLYYLLRFSYEPSKIYRIARYAFEGEYDDATIYKWLYTFCRRFFIQQFKRSCLPDGPKVGTVALSPRGDWRMPSDACSEVWLRDLEKVNPEVYRSTGKSRLIL